MKKICFLFLSIVLVGLSSCRDDLSKGLQHEGKGDKTETRSPSSNIFYWHNGERILLFPDNEKEYIIYRASDENTLFQSFSKGLSNKKRGELPSYTTSLYVPSKHRPDIKEEKLKWAIIPKTATLSARSEILYRGDFYTNEKGHSVGLSHLFYVKLKSEKDFEILKEYAKKYNLWIISQNKYMPQWYTLAAIQTNYSTLDLANIFHETGLFDVAQPDIIVDEDLTLTNPNDPLFPIQ